jgi:hypothetical protein
MIPAIEANSVQHLTQTARAPARSPALLGLQRHDLLVVWIPDTQGHVLARDVDGGGGGLARDGGALVGGEGVGCCWGGGVGVRWRCVGGCG